MPEDRYTHAGVATNWDVTRLATAWDVTRLVSPGNHNRAHAYSRPQLGPASTPTVNGVTLYGVDVMPNGQILYVRKAQIGAKRIDVFDTQRTNLHRWLARWVRTFDRRMTGIRDYSLLPIVTGLPLPTSAAVLSVFPTRIFTLYTVLYRDDNGRVFCLVFFSDHSRPGLCLCTTFMYLPFTHSLGAINPVKNAMICVFRRAKSGDHLQLGPSASALRSPRLKKAPAPGRNWFDTASRLPPLQSFVIGWTRSLIASETGTPAS